MIADLSESGANQKTQLANLRLKEAELVREIALIEKALSGVRQQIERVSERANSPQLRVEKFANQGGEPLPTLVVAVLREAPHGLSLAELASKVAERQHFQSRRPRSMLDQAICRLKKRGLITRCQETRRIVLNESDAGRLPSRGSFGSPSATETE